MAKQRAILMLCLALLLLPAARSMAQQESTPEEAVEKEAVKKETGAADGEEVKSTLKSKPKSEARSAADNKKSAAEIFIPSEAISEDLSVSFPVDI